MSICVGIKNTHQLTIGTSTYDTFKLSKIDHLLFVFSSRRWKKTQLHLCTLQRACLWVVKGSLFGKYVAHIPRGILVSGGQSVSCRHEGCLCPILVPPSCTIMQIYISGLGWIHVIWRCLIAQHTHASVPYMLIVANSWWLRLLALMFVLFRDRFWQTSFYSNPMVSRHLIRPRIAFRIILISG